MSGLAGRRSPLFVAAARRNSATVDRTALGETGIGLCDLSLSHRFGVTGTGSVDWLRANETEFPSSPNKLRRLAKGDMIVRLSDQEFLYLSLFQKEEADKSDCVAAEAVADGAYLIPRQHSHCLFGLKGKDVAAALASLCAVDLRAESFSDRDVAQTIIAKVDAIVIRTDLNEIPSFLILAAASAADYLWHCLQEAIGDLEVITADQFALGQDSAR